MITSKPSEKTIPGGYLIAFEGIDGSGKTTAAHKIVARLQQEGVPATPILDVAHVLADPQVRHRQMVVEMAHPSLGPLPTLGTPIKVDGQGGLVPAPPPRLGEHTNELLAGGTPANLDAAAEFSRKAIERIEAGAVPVGVDAAKWNKDANLAMLHQNLALVAARQDKPDEALQHYEKSSSLAGKDIAINARNTLGCGTIHKSKYDDAVAKYQALPEAARTSDPPAAEATAAIDLANQEADAAIDCWARFLAVTAANPSETRNKVEQALAALYQYRHPDEPQGYQALVEKYKTGS